MQQQQIQIVRDECFINSIDKILFWVYCCRKIAACKSGNNVTHCQNCVMFSSIKFLTFDKD